MLINIGAQSILGKPLPLGMRKGKWWRVQAECGICESAEWVEFLVCNHYKVDVEISEFNPQTVIISTHDGSTYYNFKVFARSEEHAETIAEELQCLI